MDSKIEVWRTHSLHISCVSHIVWCIRSSVVHTVLYHWPSQAHWRWSFIFCQWIIIFFFSLQWLKITFRPSDNRTDTRQTVSSVLTVTFASSSIHSFAFNIRLSHCSPPAQKPEIICCHFASHYHSIGLCCMPIVPNWKGSDKFLFPVSVSHN